MVNDELKAYWEMFRGNIQVFAEFFFPHLLSCKSAGFHSTVYQELSKENQFLAVEIFRGGAKSTIGLIIKPIHFAIFKPIGDISLISKSEQFVLNEINRKIKFELEHNEKLRTFFGDMTTDKWSESYFVLRNGIAFEGMGIGGQLRGGRRGLIMLDDLEDEETASSEDQRDKLRRRINKELIPKLLPNAEMAYFGTPIHQLCYLHQIIKTPSNGWKKLVFPAYKTSDQREGNEQWKDMFPHSRLQTLKNTMGSNFFSAEFLCDPTSDESSPIKEGQIKYWYKSPERYTCVIAVDPAYSEDEKADYKVASVVAVDQNSNRYLIEYIRTHEQIGAFQDHIIDLYKRYQQHLTGVGIPNSGVEKAFFESFIRKCNDRNVPTGFIMELKNTFTNAQTQVSYRNKKARTVAALQPLFEQGKYFIHPDHMEARDELLTIGQSQHDDIVDTLCYAENIISPASYVFEEPMYPEYEPDEEPVKRGDTGYGDGL